jgi:arsenate reductase
LCPVWDAQKETGVKATIWHNPECGKSRATLGILEARDDVDLTIVRYLETPPSREKLAQLYRDAGLAPREGVRTFKTDAEARGLTSADDDTVLDAMIVEPRLIERPLVETEKGVRLCRPPEKVEEIL